MEFFLFFYCLHGNTPAFCVSIQYPKNGEKNRYQERDKRYLFHLRLRQPLTFLEKKSKIERT